MDTAFTAQEHALLVTILTERQRELLHEIARTDLHAFRRQLQEREALLESLLRKLGPEVRQSAA